MSDVLDWLGSLSAEQITLGLVPIAGFMVVLAERRLAVASLLLQYLLVALFLANWVYLPIAALKGLIGCPICLILYLGARRLGRPVTGRGSSFAGQQAQQSWVGRPRGPSAASDEGLGFRAQTSAQSQADSSPTPRESYVMSAPFRITVVALGAVAAFGLWRAYPLEMFPPTVNLAGYWLMIMGVLLIATSGDPLRIGLGLLTFANGFETLFITLDSSLTVFALLGSIDIMIALAIAQAADRWIQAAEVARE